MPTFSQSLAIESWVLYGIGLFLVACRMISRRISLGSFSRYQVEEYIMLFIVLTFTGVIICTNEVASNGRKYLPHGAAELLTPEQVDRAIYRGKMRLALEEFTLATTWSVKACILIMYGRLTLGFKNNLIVKLVAVYCAIGFIVTQILYLAIWCRPIHEYWAVPVINSQCATHYHHMITATTFNVSSDLMLLLIPLPLLITAKLPLNRKLVLCFVFSLGIFVVLASILKRYYIFTAPYSPIFLNWCVGEVSVEVFVSNIPLCWPLVRRVFSLKPFDDTDSSFDDAPKSRHSGTFHFNSNSSANGSCKRNIFRMRSGGSENLPSTSENNVGFSDSEERIMAVWTPDPYQESADMNLRPAEDRAVFKTRVAAGNSKKEGGLLPEEKTILKTVRVSQYST